ncbi:MAG: hypothetical protein LBB41_01100, partial [Prevotellaceae bacterium]|nr:hypothetical protein [Prevotellaceae bacterium]
MRRVDLPHTQRVDRTKQRTDRHRWRGTTKYVSIENTKIEYRDNFIRDSVFIQNTIRVPCLVEVV